MFQAITPVGAAAVANFLDKVKIVAATIAKLLRKSQDCCCRFSFTTCASCVYTFECFNLCWSRAALLLCAARESSAVLASATSKHLKAPGGMRPAGECGHAFVIEARANASLLRARRLD
jgi:hypothetical protein